ncbi:MAG: hypothetical protein ACLFPX_01540 [Candidatus Omnitrophota bacterium]
MTDIVSLLVGILFLLAGRELFWFFVAVVGFMVGMETGITWFAWEAQWMVLLWAVGLGAVGALLAVFFQWAAILFAGFIGGGYFALYMTQSLFTSVNIPALIFGIGAVVGLVFMALAFHWALIILTSVAGAFLVVTALPLTEHAQWIGIGAGVVLGIVIQGVSLSVTQNEEQSQAS